MTISAVNRIIQRIDDRIRAIKTSNGYSVTVLSTRQASPPPPCTGALLPMGFIYWNRSDSHQLINGLSRRVGSFSVELWDKDQSDVGMSVSAQLSSDIIAAVFTLPDTLITSTQNARLGYTNGNVAQVRVVSEEPILELVPESNTLMEVGAVVSFEITYHTAEYLPFFQDEP